MLASGLAIDLAHELGLLEKPAAIHAVRQQGPCNLHACMALRHRQGAFAISFAERLLTMTDNMTCAVP